MSFFATTVARIVRNLESLTPAELISVRDVVALACDRRGRNRTDIAAVALILRGFARANGDDDGRIVAAAEACEAAARIA